MANLIHNERVKYTATYVNTIAIGCLVIGFLTPAQKMFEGAADIPVRTIVAACCWLLASGILHVGVRLLLRRLRE